MNSHSRVAAVVFVVSFAAADFVKRQQLAGTVVAGVLGVRLVPPGHEAVLVSVGLVQHDQVSAWRRRLSEHHGG